LHWRIYAHYDNCIESEVIALLLTLQNGKSPKPQMSLDKIIALTARCKALPDHDTRSPDEIIGYDEFGIPS
jgi:hypothetical protein